MIIKEKSGARRDGRVEAIQTISLLTSAWILRRVMKTKETFWYQKLAGSSMVMIIVIIMTKQKNDNTQKNSKWLCGYSDETVNFACIFSQLVNCRHDWIAMKIHWELCKRKNCPTEKCFYIYPITPRPCMMSHQVNRSSEVKQVWIQIFRYYKSVTKPCLNISVNTSIYS